MGIQKLSHFHITFLETQFDSKVIVKEDPLMMRELNKVNNRSHLNQFQTCQEKIRVLGDFVGELHFNQLSGEELDQ